jgi:hypothetical protein
MSRAPHANSKEGEHASKDVMSSKPWDFPVTRNCMYPNYYIVHVPGSIGKVCSSQNTNQKERLFMTKKFHDNKFNQDTTYFPVANQNASIARDLPLIGFHYPAYQDHILLCLYNRDKCNSIKDDSNKKAGPWYGMLGMIAMTHASAISRQHLPRGSFPPPGTLSDSSAINDNYPTWEWETVNQKIVGDIVCVHYQDWYFDFCQTKLEQKQEMFGSFFAALEMLLDYVAYLVQNKYNAIMTSFHLDRDNNGTTFSAIETLNQNRNNQYQLMIHRFFENNWNLERYDPTHEDNL